MIYYTHRTTRGLYRAMYLQEVEINRERTNKNNCPDSKGLIITRVQLIVVIN